MRSGRLPSISPWTATLTLVAGLTALRLLAVFATPLELYPDEAQYWLWSRELAWGYYSKPPMVAWIIAATTAIGGDSEPWVRLGAVLAHAGAPLALHRAGARLYDGWSGFWTAVVYSLMPGVQLSAGVMTTDAPMLLFLALALWAYAALLKSGSGRTSLFAAAGLGAALGLAVLSKYAALYLVAGILLHGALDRAARARWRPEAMAAAAGAAVLVWAPNLFWNATHGFATVAHTADNAQWSGDQLFNLGELVEFAGGQLGVFGPLPFLVLVTGGLAVLVRPRLRRGLRSEDLALLCLTLPPLAIVAVQAFISRANANWAVAAYAPASVLVAAWLVRSQASRWARWTLRGAVASQGLLAAVFLAAVISPAAASTLGLDNAFKRARGWEATTRVVTDWAGRRPWTAVTTDDRFLFNAMAYYGREFWARPDAPPLRMWVRETQPQNQAETEAPLQPSEAGLVLHASLVPA
ncbi:MAG: glycosyltransferase family 39 protein, partial [Proteobacteria bacterium]|nr:glycosyltransferase family 39 protein [Pseudomonadota bacterium]